MSTSKAKVVDPQGGLRAALVSAALALLDDQDADALSLRAVARRAGVSAMAPYRHYADKESLLAAVAAEGFDRLRLVLQAADTEDDEGGGGRAALIAQAVAYVRFALDHPGLFRLMFGPKRSGVHAALAASGDMAYAVLAARVAAEARDAATAPLRALACWSLVHGLASLLLDGRIRHSAAPEPETLTRLVAASLLDPV